MFEKWCSQETSWLLLTKRATKAQREEQKERLELVPTRSQETKPPDKRPIGQSQNKHRATHSQPDDYLLDDQKHRTRCHSSSAHEIEAGGRPIASKGTTQQHNNSNRRNGAKKSSRKLRAYTCVEWRRTRSHDPNKSRIFFLVGNPKESEAARENEKANLKKHSKPYLRQHTTSHLPWGGSWSHIRVPTRVSGSRWGRNKLVPRGIRFHRTRGVKDQSEQCTWRNPAGEKGRGSSTCIFVHVYSKFRPVKMPWETSVKRTAKRRYLISN